MRFAVLMPSWVNSPGGHSPPVYTGESPHRQLTKTSQIECVLCWVNVTGEVEPVRTRASYISMTVDPTEQYREQYGMYSTPCLWSVCSVWSVGEGNASQYGRICGSQGGCVISYFPALISRLY